jgi:hypothetical protein
MKQSYKPVTQGTMIVLAFSVQHSQVLSLQFASSFSEPTKGFYVFLAANKMYLKQLSSGQAVKDFPLVAEFSLWF